jgi:tetratricopeptide (TPR) repeat protein
MRNPTTTSKTSLRPALSAAALAVCCLLPGSAQAQRDVIVPLNGSRLTGVILSVSPVEIEIDVSGNPRKIQVNEIQTVMFTEDPRDLGTARSRALDGQFEEALAMLSRITPDSINRDLIKQDLEFYRALSAARISLSGGGDKSAAAKALIDFINAYPQSFHNFEAAELVGDLAYSLGRFDAASEYYQKLAMAPWPEHQLRAKVLDARALAGQGKMTEAQQRYEEVIAATVDSAAALKQKTFAQIGRAVCLAELGNPDQGLTTVESIIRDNDPQGNAELFARAYNAQGLCHLKADRPKDALLAFLHVDLLFNSDYDAHAQSLYYLSQLWTTVGRSDRAVASRSLLKSRYAGTVWASRE